MDEPLLVNLKLLREEFRRLETDRRYTTRAFLCEVPILDPSALGRETQRLAAAFANSRWKYGPVVYRKPAPLWDSAGRPGCTSRLTFDYPLLDAEGRVVILDDEGKRHDVFCGAIRIVTLAGIPKDIRNLIPVTIRASAVLDSSLSHMELCQNNLTIS
jgi:hypothetical protein